MSLFYTYLFIAFSVLAWPPNRPVTPEQELQSVLNELSQSVGLAHPSKYLPELEIVNNSNIQIASYLPASNQIQVDAKLIDFAQTLKSENRHQLYAFVLGHELGHFFRSSIEKNTSNSFCHTNLQEEQDADLFGATTAMIAGYSSLAWELPTLMQQVYQHCEITTPLTCYPDLPTRQQTALQAIQKADSLYQLFRLANYLSAIHAFEPAIKIYDHLIAAFPFPEFYNNRGVLYCLAANEIRYAPFDNSHFRYPFEFDLDSRIRKIIWRGALGISADSPKQYLIIQGQSDLQLASVIIPDQEKYQLNLAAAHIMLGAYPDADRILSQHCHSNGESEALLRAILLAKQFKAERETCFEALLDASDPRIRQLATYNSKKGLFRSHTHVDSLSFQDVFASPTGNEELGSPKTPAFSYARILRTPSFQFKTKDKYRYGWERSAAFGDSFVIWEKDNPVIAFQVLQEAPITRHPSHAGLNFQVYPIKNTKASIVHLGEEKIYVRTFSKN